MRFRLLTASLALCGALLAIFSCGGSSGTDAEATPSEGGVLLPDASAPSSEAGAFRPDASCPVLIDKPALLEAAHVPFDTVVTYNSNPPSSGPHYAVWAAFKEYDHPVDWRYLVHDLEHGAVVLSYKCASPTACPDVVASLRTVAESLPADPLCAGGAVKNRIVIVPDPNLASPVAAAAWGHTYNGDCVDAPTLTTFATENYGKGPEDLCANGDDSL